MSQSGCWMADVKPEIPTLSGCPWLISWSLSNVKLWISTVLTSGFKISIFTALLPFSLCAWLSDCLIMAPWLRVYPIEIPSTPPTPCPSPIGLADLGLHTSFPRYLPENGDQNFQSPVHSPCGALFKRPKATGVSIAFLVLLFVGINLRYLEIWNQNF